MCLECTAVCCDASAALTIPVAITAAGFSTCESIYQAYCDIITTYHTVVGMTSWNISQVVRAPPLMSEVATAIYVSTIQSFIYSGLH